VQRVALLAETTHVVTVLRIDGRELAVGPLEAFDRTPVVDIKPVPYGSPWLADGHERSSSSQ
jgi:tRNA (Thr-GGU) A37 N-methylase